ncbi:BQ2448_6073 [Microbotryum intermedium]|uniref:BQ2448_6073 protein n=1 Tax=Microbotryum intermedium TaxID=269621 RepID=A0A238FNS0_9BASI|nr:BQ2448_6073 [Microbotryum intermedium]
MVAPRPSTSFAATLSRRMTPQTVRNPLLLPSISQRIPTSFIQPSQVEQRRSILSVAAFRNLLSRRRRDQDDAVVQSLPQQGRDKESALQSQTPQGLFDTVAQEPEIVESVKVARGQVGKATYHKSSTANFKTSKRKLNDLSRLIAGRGADEAILQLKLSPKKQAPRLLSMLALARDHAMAKGLSRDQLVVAQSWTSKGPSLKRVDIKGRGRLGIKQHNSAKLHVLLAEGLTEEEKRRQRKKDQWRKSIRGLTESDGVGVGKGGKPLINVGVGGWRW